MLKGVLGDHPRRLVGWCRYRLDGLGSRVDVTPLQVALLYAALGFGALYVTDVVLVRTVENRLLLQRVRLLEGSIEVLVTAGLLHVLTRRSRRAVARTDDRLQRQQAELDVLHRVLRHNLRNDANVVRGYAELVKERLSRPELEEQCNNIIDVAENIAHYTKQASKINDVAARDDAMVTHDLADLLPRVLDDHPHLTDDVDVSTTLPDAAPVEVNRAFPETVRELLTNAVVHNDRDDPAVSVTVDPGAGPPHVTELAIADNGPGIPTHERETLLRHSEDQLVHSSGMGLWFVHWTVEMSDGDYEIEDRDPRGTTIRLYLPKTPATVAYRTFAPEHRRSATARS